MGFLDFIFGAKNKINQIFDLYHEKYSDERLWKISGAIESIEKNLNAIDKINEIFNADYFVDVEAKTSLVNKNISPFNYELPFEKTIRDSLKVIQSKVLTRSYSLSKRVKIGKIKNTGINKFTLETNLNNYNISEIEIYVNKELCTLVSEENLLTENLTWHLNKDGKTIKVFTTLTQPILEVSILLKPLLPEIIKKREGYYIRLEENFDYDKKSITVTAALNTSSDVEETIPEGKEKHFFLNSNIDKNSIKIEHYENEAWSEIEFSLYEASFNHLDGILIIPPAYLNFKKRISYKHFNVKSLELSDYEIWTKDNSVKGLYLYPQNVSFETRVDTLGTANEENYYLYDGSYSTPRADITNNNSFILSSPNIIKGSLAVSDSLFDGNAEEVDYLDGFSEFLNLEKMRKDYCPAIEKNSEGKVTFSLQEIPYLNFAYSKDIEVYDSNGIQVLNPEYSLNERILTFKLNQSDQTSSNYFVSYYYQSDQEAKYKYSVDYSNGIIFLSEDIDPEVEINISYSIGRVGVEYYIYNEIKNIEVDYPNSQIKVFSEEFHEINKNIKFLAFKNKDIYNFEGLEEYFSPIIYSLEIGLK